MTHRIATFKKVASHRDKCVMYNSYTDKAASSAQGWLKCQTADTNASACTGFPAPPSPPAPAAGTGAHLLRTTFTAPTTVRSATVYLSAVGWAELLINGVKVAPTEALSPGRTTFDMRQWYTAHNVSGLLLPGVKNVIAIQAAAGWQSMATKHGGYQLTVRAVLKIRDGATGARTDVATTTAAWVATRNGPITSANIYKGESYDATKELPGWATAAFTPSAGDGWVPASASTEFRHVVPTWQPMQPIKKLEVNTAVNMNKITLPAQHNKVVYVYEFAQNAAGTGVYSLKGCPKGTRVDLYYSEVLCGYGTNRWSPPCPANILPSNGTFGTVDQRNMGNWLTSYTCKGSSPSTTSNTTSTSTNNVLSGGDGGGDDGGGGDGTEEWQATFTYTGHRFIEMHGHDWAEPTLATVTQVVMHSDVEGAPIPDAEQAHPRILAGSIAFGGSAGAAAPAIDGPLCWHGENCSAARPVGVAAKTAVLDQISHIVRWDLIDNLHSVPEGTY